MKRILLALLSGIFIFAAAYSVWRVVNYDQTTAKVSGQPHYMNGKQLDQIQFTLLNGQKISLKKYLTGDINIINFWASWCEPCNKEMPELVQFNKDKPGHINIIGANIQDSKGGRKEFIKKYNADYTMLIADNKAVKKNKIYNIPTTFFVDRNGKVLKTYSGQIDEQKIKTLIQQIEGE